MARRIAAGGFYPVWRYGTSSIGAFFSYVVFFLSPLFPIDKFGIFAAELVFSLLFIIMSYFIGRILFGNAGGLISLVLAVFAPSLPIEAVIYPTGVYNILIGLGSIMFFLAFSIPGKRDKLFLYSVLGLVGGVSFWVHFYSLCFLIPCILFILINENQRKTIFLRNIFIFILLFVLGGFPAFKNFTLNPLEDITTVYAKSIFSIQAILFIVYIFVFIYLVYKVGERLFMSKEILLVLFVLFCAVFTARFDVKPLLGIHPAVILYAGFPYILTFFLLKIREKSRYVFFTFLFSIIMLQTAETCLSLRHARKENVLRNKSLQDLADYLQRENINFIYTTEELVPVIAFMSNEKIKPAFYAGMVEPDYTDAVDASIQPAIVMPSEKGDEFIKNLRYACDDFKTIRSGEYILFHSFVKPHAGQTEISPVEWSAVSNFNNKDTGMAFDRDMSTRWTTHFQQIPGMYFMLDMGKGIFIDKIILYHGEYIHDIPMGLEIECSNDMQQWERLIYLQDNTSILFWEGMHLFWKSYADCSQDCSSLLPAGSKEYNRQEYYFKPVKIRYIRFDQLGYKYTSHYYWSIVEVFIYGPTGPKTR